jgi:hypothetical protein
MSHDASIIEEPVEFAAPAPAAERETKPESPRAHAGSRLHLALLALGALVTVFVYGRILGHELIPTWDDGFYLLNHSLVTGWSSASWFERLTTPELGYPSPLPTALYAALRGLGDAYVPAVRALQIVLHLIGGFGLFAFVKSHAERPMAAAVTALLWWLHPVNVETVAWATNLKTSIFGACALVSLALWQRATHANQSGRSTAWRIGSIALLTLAAASRPEAIVIPVLWALVSLGHHRDLKTVAKQTGIWLAAGLLLGLTTGLYGYLTHTGFAKGSHLVDRSVMGRLAEVFDSVRRAIQSLAVPFDLSPMYATHAEAGVVQVLPGVLLAFALLALLAFALRRSAFSEATFLALAATAWLPYSNLTPLPRWVADTYVYLPGAFGIGFAVLAAERIASKHGGIRAAALAATVALLISVGASANQVARWESGLTLFAPVIEREPSLAKPYMHVAYHYWTSGDAAMAAQVLDLGSESFATQELAPFWGPAVYVEADRPADGAVFGVHALRYTRTASSIDELLMTALLKSSFALANLEPRDVSNVEQSIARLTQSVHQEPTQRLAAIGQWLVVQNRTELALPFLKEAASRDDAPCALWNVIAAAGASEELPQAPAACAQP